MSLRTNGSDTDSDSEHLALLSSNKDAVTTWQLTPAGTVQYLSLDPSDPSGSVDGKDHHTQGKDDSEHQLAEWPATSICGNDITSSCLYVIGLATYYAGMYAPLALILVAIVLFLFRKIYAEVGSALPLNGASYTLLLNVTSKVIAALGACLTLISYVSTAVVSASTAMYYAHNLWDGLDPYWATIGVLGFFAALNLLGITESSIAALLIFLAHMVTLGILIGYSVVNFVQNPHILRDNWNLPSERSFGESLFYGFAAGMLGITGFESSANFIEQQKPGVFPKTLRNMWAITAFINPALSFLCLANLPLSVVSDANNPDLLASLGNATGGKWLQQLVSADATLVLCGGVLTSYVGVTGLVRRMSLDRCLLQLFLATNRLRGTNHWIILTFFAVCSSMSLILGNNLTGLSGVYTIAFLSVMFLFALGDFMLKYKRGKLPREVRAQKTSIIFAMIGVGTAFIGNILANPDNLKYFFIYYICTVILVMLMFLRLKAIKFAIFYTYAKLKKTKYLDSVMTWLVKKARAATKQPMIFLAQDDNIALLNKAILYVRDNELTDHLQVVHVYDQENDMLRNLEANTKILDTIYPKIKIDFVGVKGEFSPKMIDMISRKLSVPKNLIFISCPTEQFSTKFADLGGVRIITTD